MKILSVNIGQTRPYPWRNGTESAILKSPVDGNGVAVTSLGLEGDEQADLKVHGGADKAVLCIPQSNYALFEIHQGFGFLGENLTLSDVDETQIQIGDQLQVGDVVLEVSQPRSPCWKLSEITQDPQFLKRYSDSGRVGFYCRVLQPGTLERNEQVSLRHPEADNEHPAISIQSLFLAKYRVQTRNTQTGDLELLALAVQHPALSDAWRQELTKLLEGQQS
jgi:MOSC domain-containing protein YiiM